MAIGCATLIEIFNNKKIGVIIVVTLCLGLTVTSPFLGYSRDNEIFYHYDYLEPYEEVFNEEDLVAFSFAEKCITETVYSERIHADYIDRVDLVSGGSTSEMLDFFTKEGYSNNLIKVTLYPYTKAERSDLKILSATTQETNYNK